MLLTFQIIFLIILPAALALVKGMTLDDTAATTTVSGGSLDDQIKCGGCPCNNPCYIASPPPPPPSPPSPPPPKVPSATPGLNYCPPPPTVGGYALGPPSYIYITGPPENLYPVNPYFSGAHSNFRAAPTLLVVSGLLSVLIGC